MIIDIEEDALLVISDLHVGNPFCSIRGELVRFLNEAADKGWSLCINGDGLDIMQTSFKSLAAEVPELFTAFKRFQRKGGRVYYVVGNHDLLFENFLDHWGHFAFSPFLNLRSGKARVRIEHGFLYDAFFVRSPELYERLVHIGGFFLHLFPRLYKLWILFEAVKNKKGKHGDGYEGIDGEAPEFAAAAKEILQRGFDAVIFGHTHHPGSIQLAPGQYYYNSGSFMLAPTYILIDQGSIALREWEPGGIPLPVGRPGQDGEGRSL